MITKPIISFCTGSYHACAVFDTNMAKCWGLANSFGLGNVGRLGDVLSETGDNIPYLNLGTNALVAEISCGVYHTCARTVGGGMKCVGDGRYGKTGLPISSWVMQSNSLPFANLGTGIDTLSITTGAQHTCAKVTGNKVKCFGSGQYGQHGLGNNTNVGTSASQMGDNLGFVDLGAGVEAASIYSGPLSYHTCAILSAPASVAQRIKCWGQGGYQLGYNSQNNIGDQSGEMGDNLPLVDYGAESRVKQIAVGDGHTCAVLFNDNMKCYGYGANGQLGSGSMLMNTPLGGSFPIVTLDSGFSVDKLSIGSFHTCIVYNNLVTMKCFGTNGNGELGQSDTFQRGGTPSTMIPSIPAIDLGTGSLAISMIKSGLEFNCVVFVDGSVKCFGRNSEGNLGIGSTLSVGNDPNEMGASLKFTSLFSPTQSPSKTPSAVPTNAPTLSPSKSPNTPSKDPTRSPAKNPSKNPTTNPSRNPTLLPTNSPTSKPTTSPAKNPTNNPTTNPSRNPTQLPTKAPTFNPTAKPSDTPTYNPSYTPTNKPTSAPTNGPTSKPSRSPNETSLPTTLPSKSPTMRPSATPSLNPSRIPSKSPTRNPSTTSSKSPSKTPTQSPTTVSRGDDVGLAVGLSLGLLGAAGIIGYIYRNRAKFMKPQADQLASDENGNNSKKKQFLLALPRV